VVVGTGYDIIGGKSGGFPNEQTDIVVDQITPGIASVFVQAYEDEPTDAVWAVRAYAICLTRG
jgi:hypothetical protein